MSVAVKLFRTLDELGYEVHEREPMPEWDNEPEDTKDDRYMLHGILARLQAVLNDVHNAWGEPEAFNMYDSVTRELINTLQAYLSQG